MKKRAVILSVTAAMVLGGYLLTVSQANAAVSPSGYPPILEKISQKFNLKLDDLKAVFDEERVERQKEMQAKLEERLAGLVSEGKITEEQKQLLVAKYRELQEKRQSEMAGWQNLTPVERRELSQAWRQEMKDWAAKNGISEKYLFWGRGERGMGMKMMGGW